MIKAIFFDQDNTLVNSSEIAPFTYHAAIDFVASELGLDSEELFKSWQDTVARIITSKDIAKRHFRYSLTESVKSHNPTEELIDKALRIYYDKIEYLVKSKEGVKEFFNKNLNLKKIVTTEDSKEKSELKLKKIGIWDKIDLQITSDDTEIMKPDVKFFEIGWKKFNLKPEECIYVGDNWEKDCQIGHEKGGISVVFGKVDERADYSISNMLELYDIIKAL